MVWKADSANVHEASEQFGDFNFTVRAVEGAPGSEPRFSVLVGQPDMLGRYGGTVVIADRVDKSHAFDKIHTFVNEAKRLYSVLNGLEEKFGRHE